MGDVVVPDSSYCSSRMQGGSSTWRHAASAWPPSGSRLAFAVIAEAPRLQHRGQADGGQRSGASRREATRRTARSRYRDRATKFFSAKRSCVVGEHRSGRAAPVSRGRECRRLRRHVLEFEGHDVARAANDRAPRDRHSRPRSRAARPEGGRAGLVGRRRGRLKPSRAAASASMRPSCPPPKMPIVPPGRRTRELSGHSRAVRRRLGDRVGLARAPGREPFGAAAGSLSARIAAASRPAFLAPALADGQGADRNAARHLDDGQQAVHALQRLGFDRHAEHRQGRHRRRHARQMGRAAGAGDDHLKPARLGRLGIGEKRSGVRCAETIRASCGTPSASSISAACRHGRPVGLAAHDEADERRRAGHASSMGRRLALGPEKRRIIGSRANWKVAPQVPPVG